MCMAESEDVLGRAAPACVCVVVQSVVCVVAVLSFAQVLMLLLLVVLKEHSPCSAALAWQASTVFLPGLTRQHCSNGLCLVLCRQLKGGGLLL